MIESTKMPQHIAIIMDGNRRYAKKKNLSLLDGHRKGAEKLTQVLEWCKEFNIKELTLYTFSMQNFSRTKEEVDFLMNLFREYFAKFMKDKTFEKNKIKVKAIGRKQLFPQDIQQSMTELENKTKNYDNHLLNFAMGYGGREEIVDAFITLAKKIENKTLSSEEITELTINDALYLSSAPDILIRTGGEQRLSNFLLWQCSYTELFFVDKFWPEFSKEEFASILKQFNERERRFGK